MEAVKKLNPRKVFLKCGACSHAMFHLLNHEFGNVKPLEEKASDMLAGGIAQKGYQCGMIWGSTLAIGTEAYRKYKDKNNAIALTIDTSKLLLDSFSKRAKAVNCRNIAKVDWDNKFQLVVYLMKTFAQGLIFSPCFNLLVKWTPEAIQTAKDGMSEKGNYTQSCVCCSTEVVKKMGGTEEESIMVAGFAGGIGLSGNACGALAAAIWYKMLETGKNNPEKSQPLFNNPRVKRILTAFYTQTNSEMLCKNISKKNFNSIDEHSQYVREGGCKNIIDALAIA